MNKIMFVCHGNICRSPMAEFIMKEIVRTNNKSDEYYIESSATSLEEIGNDVYYKAKETLDLHNIPYNKRKARQITQQDYDEFDYIIIMDYENLYGIRRIIKDDQKVKRLLSFTNDDRDISDPWYTRDFEKSYDDIYRGCLALFSYLNR